MPHSRKPKPAQHDPRTMDSSQATPTAADEQRKALQMSMDMRQ